MYNLLIDMQTVVLLKAQRQNINDTQETNVHFTLLSMFAMTVVWLKVPDCQTTSVHKVCGLKLVLDISRYYSLFKKHKMILTCHVCIVIQRIHQPFCDINICAFLHLCLIADMETDLLE